MWKQLFAKSEQPVEFVALEGHVLTVSSPQRLVSDRLKLRLKEREVGVRFRPHSVREVPSGFIYAGRVTSGLKSLEPGARPLEQGEERFLRANDRLPFKTRVLSREVPGFRAVSVDLSPGGMQLETQGPVEVGSTVRCKLDLGHHGDTLTFEARVAWSQCLSEGRSRLGLEFTLVEGDGLERIYDSLHSQKGLSVPQLLHRALSQATDRELNTPRPQSRPCPGQLHGYQQKDRQLTVQLDSRELTFTGLGSLSDRQGTAGTSVARVEWAPQGAGWNYRLLSNEGLPVLEVSCLTGPEEVFPPED